MKRICFCMVLSLCLVGCKSYSGEVQGQCVAVTTGFANHSDVVFADGRKLHFDNFPPIPIKDKDVVIRYSLTVPLAGDDQTRLITEVVVDGKVHKAYH